jgi:3-hydroxyisobutyrate dehydrogenase-like beta-hydroxyacid dehydrogenase
MTAFSFSSTTSPAGALENYSANSVPRCRKSTRKCASTIDCRNNLSAGMIKEQIADGAHAAESPSDVAARADLIGLCLTSHEAVEEIAWGPQGLFAVPLNGSKVVADFSTGSPSSAATFATRAQAHGALWVDAPVSGGVPAAAAGTLVIFAGGAQESLAALQPLLGPLAARVSHMGPAGAGQTTKIYNQMVVACTVMLIAEWLHVGNPSPEPARRFRWITRDDSAVSRSRSDRSARNPDWPHRFRSGRGRPSWPHSMPHPLRATGRQHRVDRFPNMQARCWHPP